MKITNVKSEVTKLTVELTSIDINDAIRVYVRDLLSTDYPDMGISILNMEVNLKLSASEGSRIGEEPSAYLNGATVTVTK